MLTSAFTCTGPYAVLIMLGIKRVENRNAMPEPAKGRCAVGCSKSFCREEFGNFVQWAARALPEEEFARIPSWSDVADWPGKIVGVCDYDADEQGRCRGNVRAQRPRIASRHRVPRPPHRRVCLNFPRPPPRPCASAAEFGIIPACKSDRYRYFSRTSPGSSARSAARWPTQTSTSRRFRSPTPATSASSG